MSFSPQLALHLHKEEDKKKPAFVDEPYAIFEKYDGWYGYFDSRDKVIRSRNGRAVPSVEHLIPLLEGHVNTGILIFEILLTDVKEFSVLNGILNRKAKAENAYLRVHDYYDLVDRGANLSPRMAKAYQIVDNIGSPSVLAAPILGVTRDLDAWKRKAVEVWEYGAEGIILKALKMPYAEGKRNAGLMKIKMEVTVDLLVVSLVRGDGKYAGTLGALRCVDKAGNVHMISGMSDAQRKEWWDTPSLIVKHVVEVQAMCVLKNGSLREPRFKAVRHDKTEKDID